MSHHVPASAAATAAAETGVRDRGVSTAPALAGTPITVLAVCGMHPIGTPSYPRRLTR